MTNTYRFALLAIVLAIALSAGVVAAADNAQSISQFVRINAQHLTVQRTATLATATVTGALGVTGDAELGANLNLTPQTAATVTNGGNVTPTGAYMPLTAAGNVGTSSIVTTSAAAGDIVYFINTANVTITFTDTGTLKLSGNAALAQYDTLTVMFDGTNWIEVAQTDN